jgi:hypothetical protein
MRRGHRVNAEFSNRKRRVEMNRQWKSVLRSISGQQRKRPVRRFHLQLETLENRLVPSTAPFQHVLILSVDGLHQADVTDPALSQSLTNIVNLETTGVTYTNASTTSPSDSFPGTLAILTGATPGTTGVFYDDSYSRTLFAPGTTNPAGSTPGTEVLFDESIDKDLTLPVERVDDFVKAHEITDKGQILAVACLIWVCECSGNDDAEFANIAHVHAAHIRIKRKSPADGSVSLQLRSRSALEALVVHGRDDERMMCKPGILHNPINLGFAGKVRNVELAAADRFDIRQR